MRPPRRRNSNDRGATLVEFAVVLPLLLLLIFAIMEFGRLSIFYAEIWTSAREGARHATTIGDADGNGLPNFVDCADIRVRALAKVTMQGVAPADIAIDYLDVGGDKIADCDPGTSGPANDSPQESGDIDPGTQIRVTVERAYDAIVPLVGGFVDGVPLDSTQSRAVHYGAPE